MPVFIALLRAVNVGGNSIIPMADLKALCAKLGFKDAKTLLQSGNVVLSARARRPRRSRKNSKPQFTPVSAMRSASSSARRKNCAKPSPAIPTAPPRADDSSHLLVNFLADAPTADAAKALAAWKHATEPHKVDGCELFIHYKSGIGTSKFAGPTIERLLATSGTARNWNTINKLIALAEEMEG